MCNTNVRISKIETDMVKIKCQRLYLKNGSKEILVIRDDVCINCRLDANRYFQKFSKASLDQDFSKNDNSCMDFNSFQEENFSIN